VNTTPMGWKNAPQIAGAIKKDARGLGMVDAVEVDGVEIAIPELCYAVACVGCGITMHLQMIPQRDRNNQIVGWLFSCETCRPSLIGREFAFVIQD